MATARFVFRNKNTTSAYLYIRYIHKGDKTDVNTKLKINPAHWTDNGMIGRNEKNISNISITNAQLSARIQRARSMINELEMSGEINRMTCRQLADCAERASDRLTPATKVLTVSDYMDQLITQLEQAHKYGNAAVYFNTRSFLLRCGYDNITFREMTYKTLKSLETQHYAAGNHTNSLSVYMRTLRATYNRAAREGLASRTGNPFADYKIRQQATAKRRISIAEFHKIIAAEFTPKQPEYHARNYFLFSFYLRGMNFPDMAYIRVHDVAGDRLQYRRAKTGQLFDVAMPQQARAIVNLYSSGKKPGDFLFPIIKRDGIFMQRQDIASQRRFYNRLLRRLSDSLQLSRPLTSYVSRHSWATLAKDAGIPVEVISEGLGHTDVKTTQIYLDSFAGTVIDDATARVANLLTAKKKIPRTGKK